MQTMQNAYRQIRNIMWI